MTGIIILAAGASTRLGSPKQLLLYQGKTFLQQTIDTAVATHFSPAILVLGAHETIILPQLKTAGVQVCHNEQWAEGMASSVRLGINLLQQQAPQVENVTLLLCDQPFVSVQLLNNLSATHISSGKKIVACAYKNTLGVPVLFDRSFFPHLLKLQGQEGAKYLLSKYADQVAEVDFPEGAIDIDTIADYEQLLQRNLSDIV